MTGYLGLLRLGLLAPVLAYALANAGYAVELDPKAVVFQTPNQFKWRDPFNKSPSNAVLLHGDGVNGFYVSLTKWNKGGNFSRPHSHANDRMIYVLGGTWWNGTGTAFDPPNTIPMRAGTFVTHHAKGVHWDGAKDEEDAVLVIAGVGPAASTQATQTQGTFSTLNTAAVTFLAPEQFKWRDPFNKSPTNQVILYGDPSKEGPYMVINRFSPGAFSRPHFHPNDRFITVLKGPWWVGTGAKFDTNNTVPMPAGTFVTHFGKGIHYDGAKDEEVMVLITGMGPATSTQVKQN
jgi:predicted metal-dependent enzyme (double-stranded beta helix superfamily)